MEPIYEYVKGKGWVLSLPVGMTLACGTKVHLVVRDLVVGDRYIARSPHGSPSFFKGQEVNWDRVKDYYSGYRLIELPEWRVNYNLWENKTYIVFVPL